MIFRECRSFVHKKLILTILNYMSTKSTCESCYQICTCKKSSLLKNHRCKIVKLHLSNVISNNIITCEAIKKLLLNLLNYYYQLSEGLAEF